MQTLRFFIFGLLSTIAFLSCGKENDDPKTVIPIEGKWVGKYSILSEPYNDHYSFRFNETGILERLDISGEKAGEGTWEFSNNNTVVSGTYTMSPPATGTFSFVANFDTELGELDGTWGYDENEYNGGYWYMSKVD